MMSSKKQRRLNAALRRKENAQSPVTRGNDQKAIEAERDYENAISHSHELAPRCIFESEGKMGPDIPEPKDYEPY